MTTATLKKDIDPQDKGDYLELSFIAEEAIGDEIAQLKSYKRHHANAVESAKINSNIADLEADRAKIRADRLAFLAEQRKIVPPTKNDFQKAIMRAKEIDEMIVKEGTLNALLEAGADIIKIMANTRE